jgi:phosphate transport system protein
MVLPMSRHTLDDPLRTLHDGLVGLSCNVDLAIQQASRALVIQDLPLARQVVAGDAQINARRYELENHCLAIMATQQPTAHDLHLIMAVYSMAGELERMADLAGGLATLTLWRSTEPPHPMAADLIPMADHCHQMLHQAIDAYVKQDVQLAHAVIAHDDQVDELYQHFSDYLVAYMSTASLRVPSSLPLLFAAHNLERIADRAVNLAERSLFVMNIAWKSALVKSI